MPILVRVVNACTPEALRQLQREKRVLRQKRRQEVVEISHARARERRGAEEGVG